MPNYGYEERFGHPTRSIHHCVPLSQPGKQIRVLDLFSLTSDATCVLHCRLRVLSLPTDEAYATLSYVWAQEDPGTSERLNRLIIYCTGHTHEARLGPNCWSALWHIRKTRKRLGVWVDSICIDQSNDGEKQQQIPLMRSIYMSACVTYFWLGEAGNGTDEAIDFLSTSSQLTGKGGIVGKIRAAIETSIRDLTSQSRPNQAGLVEILGRPWITRLWTLQECLLSHNGVFMCGHKTIAFEDFASGLQNLKFSSAGPMAFWLYDLHTPWLNLADLVGCWVANPKENGTNLDQSLQRDVEMPKLYGQILEVILRVRPLKLYYGIFMSLVLILGQIQPEGKRYWVLTGFVYILAFGPFFALAYLVPLFLHHQMTIKTPPSRVWSTQMAQHPIVEALRNRNASDPRDMFYGIMGILSNEKLLKGAGSLSIETLYRRLSASLIETTRSLDILLLAGGRTSNLKAEPSWVIDWRSKEPQILGKAVYYYEVGVIRRYFGKYSISTTPLRIIDAVRALALPLQSRDAMELDQLEFRGPMPGTTPLWEFRKSCKRLCIYGVFLTSISSHFAPRKMDTLGVGPRLLNSALYDAISNMSEYDQYYVNSLVAVLTRQTYGTVETALRNWWDVLRKSTSMIQGIEWFELMLSKDKGLRAGHQLLIRILWLERLSAILCESTALCHGGIAFGGTSVMNGDAVVLVSGLLFPLVLRPCGSRCFKLVGPIFVPGVMNGELQEMVKMIPLDEMVLV